MYQRPVFISGKVSLEDGTPLPQGVRVEMLFNGQVRRQEYTRTDGGFTFELGGSNRSTLPDASVSSLEDGPWGGRGSVDSLGGQREFGGRIDLSGWEIRAFLPGYQSDVVILASRSVLDTPDVGVIVLRPLSHVRASSVSFNTLRAPKKAREAYEQAQKALNKKKPDLAKAARELDKAVERYPEFAAAWQLLGQTRIEEQNWDGAREAFHKAMAADAKFISPYLSLASLEIQQKRWEEAVRMTAQALELNPYVTHGHLLNAIANYNFGDLQRAENSARSVMGSPDAAAYPLAHYILGALLAGKGDLVSAAKEFKTFVRTAPEDRYAAQVKQKLAEWESQGLIPKSGATAESPKPK
jgi:TolA-binding protein